MWQQFLQDKFSKTDLEDARQLTDLGANNLDAADALSITAYMEAVAHVKTNKATGSDVIPAEIFMHSELVKHELFFFLQRV